MTAVRRWGVLSGLLAPLLLVGGWTAAAALRPDAYDEVQRTISELAGLGAPHRWLMTCAFVGVGLCHGATAAALRPAALPGRILLALGGLATVLVAANPLPAAGGSSSAHTASAAAAFGALACWPALAWRRGPRVPAVLRAGPSLAAAAVLLAAVLWFAVELSAGSGRIGLAERCAAGLQALWPLAVVLALRRSGAATPARCPGTTI
jgi:hypothetical membrane protein